MIPFGAHARVATKSDMKARLGLCSMVCAMQAKATELTAKGMVTCQRLSPAMVHDKSFYSHLLTHDETLS